MAGRTVPVSESTSGVKWRRRQVSTAIVTIVALTLLVQFGGFLYTAALQERLNNVSAEARDLRAARAALVDAELAVESYAHTGDARHLSYYFDARKALDARRPIVLRMDGGQRAGRTARLDRLSANWSETLEAARVTGRETAQAMLAEGETWSLVESLRSDLDDAFATQTTVAVDYELRIREGQIWVVALQLIGGALTLAGLLYAIRVGGLEARGRRAAVNEALASRDQVERLFEMTDMLQSAADHADANAVLRATADKLLPDLGGALYVFNNSRDRLDLSVAWGRVENEAPEAIAPSQCWALKRGKPHRNLSEDGALRCEHYRDGTVLELPMTARGEVYGLLQLQADGDDAEARLIAAAPLATAMADAMSLAIANIALRERLRNQALRDPLTGLYNRRYMEDMLERFTVLSERSASPVSVIMIDLDHFKRLNDEHGHAMGDAILREAAAAVAGAMRQSDVACRYGGEELLILLPDCSMESAMAKAEILRARIEGLSDLHDVRVTASFGVSTLPETAALASDLVTSADAALYQSKQGGRNRVTAAPRRASVAATRHAAE